MEWTGTPGTLKVTTENNSTANVIISNGLYNIMTRDFVFNHILYAFKNIDGTGTGIDFFSLNIVTSSTAVIHQIDNILSFE